jgi:hypothetical protein
MSQDQWCLEVTRHRSPSAFPLRGSVGCRAPVNRGMVPRARGAAPLRSRASGFAGCYRASATRAAGPRDQLGCTCWRCATTADNMVPWHQPAGNIYFRKIFNNMHIYANGRKIMYILKFNSENLNPKIMSRKQELVVVQKNLIKFEIIEVVVSNKNW